MNTDLLMEAKSRIPAGRRRMPHAMELTVLFREFIHYWTGFKTRIPESKSFQLPADPLEYSLRWTGTIKGTLVLRSSRRFMEAVTEFFQDKGSEATDGKTLFKEMMGLYGVFIAYFMWGEDFMDLGPFLARPCQPLDFPPTPPQAFCQVEVEGEPVEIRLWIGGMEERKNETL